MSHFINEEVEEFAVQAYHQGVFKKITKQDTLGKWAVYFFYPADFTFVCPTELGDLADYYDRFQEIDCEIYSISEDTHFVHKAWADASDTIKKIQYPMLGDPAGKLATFFDVLLTEEGQALRGTFIVNPKGKIKAYEIHDLGIGRNAEELLRKVQAAQFVETHGDQVCPAKWKPGEETLTPSLDLVGML
ncbi:MAG: alkyl hydroperoxide reductase subunit C [Lachnospiraceae bacterium]